MSNPSPEEIRKARRLGFSNSIKHLPEDRRNRLTQSYLKQDDRREQNVNRVVKQVTGG